MMQMKLLFDNCSSAWYQFEFGLPDSYERASLNGVANVDDAAVLYLNGNRISAELLVTDVGIDRIDSEGLALLSWPTTDSFGSNNPGFFKSGVNTLTLAFVVT